MTDTDRLVAFLLARDLDRLNDAEFVHQTICDSVRPVPFPCDCGEPERIQADVRARRQIIAAAQKRIVGHPGECEGGLYDGCELHLEWNRDTLGEIALYFLASPHADHPDFDPAWKLPQ